MSDENVYLQQLIAEDPTAWPGAVVTVAYSHDKPLEVNEIRRWDYMAKQPKFGCSNVKIDGVWRKAKWLEGN